MKSQKGNARFERLKDPKQTPKQERTVEHFGEHPLRIPQNLIYTGKLLSAAAKVVYLVIADKNPSFPSLKGIMIDTGFGKQRVLDALDELIIKNIIYCDSGALERGNNYYCLRKISEWRLSAPVLTPSMKRKAGKEARMIITQGQEEEKLAALGDNHSKGGMIITPPGRVIITQELDQIKLDQLTLSGATHKKTQSEAVQLSRKGIPFGDIISHPLIGLPALEAEIQRRQLEREIGKSIGG